MSIVPSFLRGLTCEFCNQGDVCIVSICLPSLRCPCWLFYITKEIICDTHVENGLHKILISFINPSLNSIRAYFGKHRFY